MRLICNFRAGKCIQVGGQVRPQSGRGTLTVVSDQGIINFEWKSRTTGEADPPIVTFGDAVWKKVPQCTTGRVFVLHFPASDTQFFFWMQEPSDAKDDQYWRQINRQMNPAWTPSSETNAPSAAPAAASTSTPAPAAAAASTTSTTGGSAPARTEPLLQPDQVAALLRALDSANPGARGGAGGRPAITLDDLVSTGMNDLLDSMNTDELLAAVGEHLPQTGLSPASELRTTVTSASFREAAQMMSHALEDPNAVRTLESSFGLPSGAAGGAQVPALGLPLTPSEMFITALHRSAPESVRNPAPSTPPNQNSSANNNSNGGNAMQE